jgi:hypothetical protein
MSGTRGRGVFISYSHADREVVSVAARLLQAGGARVFQDVRDIAFGAPWKEALQEAIAKCERVLVFWSAAAASSEWVEREWRLALALGKRVVPMLLDATPLPEPLGALQGLPDLMRILQQAAPALPAAPEPARPPAPTAGPAKAARRTWLWIVAALLVAGVGAGALLLFTRGGPQMPDPGPQTPGAGPLPAALAALLGLAVAGAWLWWRRRAARRQAGPTLAEQFAAALFA